MNTYLGSFKVILVGDNETGKTDFVHRLLTGAMRNQYDRNPTLGVEVHPITFYTNKGRITLNVWDTAGKNKGHGGFLDGYYIQSQACILFFDVTKGDSFKNLKTWNNDVVQICDYIPTVICGNKVDLTRRRAVPSDPSYFDISVKNGEGLIEPIENLLCKLTGKNLTIIEVPQQKFVQLDSLDFNELEFIQQYENDEKEEDYTTNCH